MYIGEQLLNPREKRLRLSAQLGVEHVPPAVEHAAALSACIITTSPHNGDPR